MTAEEWAGIVAVITANWPHSLPPTSALAKWGSDVRDLPARQVLAAVETLARDGREFPPNGPIIRARVVELDADRPDAAEAWDLVCEANRCVGLASQTEAAVAWIAERSPLVAEAVRRFPAESLGRYNLADEQIVRAQFRDAYLILVNRRQREAAYAGLPDGGLRHLRPGPRRIGEVVRELAR